MVKRKSTNVTPVNTPTKAQKVKNSGGPSEKIVQGILKSPRGGGDQCEQHNKSVRFQPPSALQEAIEGLHSGHLDKGKIRGILTQFENLNGPSLVLWIQELQTNISVFGVELESVVVEVLKLHWYNQGMDVVEAFKSFVVNLVSAHCVYSKMVVRCLIKNFYGGASAPESDHAYLSEEEKKIFINTHFVIKGLLSVSPVGVKEELFSQVDSLFPFVKSMAHKQVCYVTAVLQMMSYLDGGEEKLLQVLVERVVKMDVHCPKNVIEQDLADEEDEQEPKLRDNQAVTLDLVMNKIFEHIKDLTHENGKYQPKKGKALFNEMMNIYNSHILTTFQISHAQFLYFYLAGLDPELLGLQFIEINWKLFTNPNTPSIYRQTAVAYIASFVSRSLAVNVHTARRYLQKLADYIHGYISLRASNSLDFMYTNLKSHGPFYAACQATFYIFAFRHKELTADSGGIKFAQSLGFNSIVTSQLNPLRVCLPGVVRNFTSVARNYQLAYCQTVIERNNRINLPVVGNLSSANVTGKPLLLDCYFPFDPYRLPNSKHWINEFYREYNGDPHDDSEDEDDDVPYDEAEEAVGTCKRERLDSISSLCSVRSTRSTRSNSVSSNIPDCLVYETKPGFKKT